MKDSTGYSYTQSKNKVLANIQEIDTQITKFPNNYRKDFEVKTLLV